MQVVGFCFIFSSSEEHWQLVTPTFKAPWFNRSSQYDVRGETEEDFEEGAKSEGFHSDTNSRQRRLNLA